MAGDASLPAYGGRFTTLRQIHRQTQSALATRLGVTQSFLSHVERGDRPAPAAMVHRAATEFGVPVAFFAVQHSTQAVGMATFRKTSRVSVKDEARVTALYDESARLFRALSKGSHYRTAELPDPHDYADDPEEVAAELRTAAGLDQCGPVPNATRSLERLGFGVIDHLDDEEHHGTHVAVSRPSLFNDRPVVALAEDVPGAVKRLTLLHEAYHLIADRELTAPVMSTRAHEERQAYRFAGAFLLPADAARERISETLNLHGYLPIKAEYGISVAAAIRRGADLGLISPHRYRSLNIQLSSAGWKHNEPVDVADEKPRLIGQALQRVFGDQGVAKASHALGIPPEWVRRWANASDNAPAPGQGATVLDLVQARANRGRPPT